MQNEANEVTNTKAKSYQKNKKEWLQHAQLWLLNHALRRSGARNIAGHTKAQLSQTLHKWEEVRVQCGTRLKRQATPHMCERERAVRERLFGGTTGPRVCFKKKFQEDKLEEEEKVVEGFKRSKRIEGGMTGKVIGKKKKAELSLPYQQVIIPARASSRTHTQIFNFLLLIMVLWLLRDIIRLMHYFQSAGSIEVTVGSPVLLFKCTCTFYRRDFYARL